MQNILLASPYNINMLIKHKCISNNLMPGANNDNTLIQVSTVRPR